MKIPRHNQNIMILIQPMLLNLFLTALLVPACISSVKWLDMEYAYGTYLLLIVGILSLFISTYLSFVRLIEYDRLLAAIVRIGAKSILNVKLDIPLQRLSKTKARRKVFSLGLTMLKHPISEPYEHTVAACRAKGRNFDLFPLFSSGWWKATFFPANLL